MSASVVLMSATHSKAEIQLSQERRDAILNFLLEWLTGDQIDSKTLGHFRFIGEMFSITPKVKEMCRASSFQGRQELCLSVALAALNLALDDSPPEPSQRQLERRERREAEKQWSKTVANLKPTPAAPVPKPVKSERPLSMEASAVAHRKHRARMTEEELDAFRVLAAQRQRERRARLRASRTV
jgi:hypothetical protein